MTSKSEKPGKVVGLNKSADHHFSKTPADQLRLIKGEGIEGDAHRGVNVKHRSRVKADPTQPNLRQVHLLHLELILELQEQGFDVNPGSMGENITTSGIDLLSLPKGAVLNVGAETGIEVTGLRNPCIQIDAYQKGLVAAVLDKDEQGNLVRKAGIMGIVLGGGNINIGDEIQVVLPTKPYRLLEVV